MATTEKTWFTKTIARETVQELTKSLVEAGEITDEVAEKFNGLFAGRTVTSNTLVRDADGNVVFKRCSYFGKYLPVSEFGTVGKDEQGNPKLSYQSKLGASCARKAKAELEKALKEADERLEEDEDIQAWKQAKAEAVAKSEVKCEFDSDIEAYDTYEEAVAALS